MAVITNEDLKLVEKFRKVFEANPTEDEALDLWSGLTVAEYDRLIALFETNRPQGMAEEVRLDLVDVFRSLRNKLAEFEAV